MERYAFGLVEHLEADWKEQQLKSFEEELSAKKAEMEAQKLDNLSSSEDEEEEEAKEEEESEEGEGEEEENEEESDDEGEDEESEEEEETEESEPEVIRSPKTRARGNVKINLWNLDE